MGTVSPFDAFFSVFSVVLSKEKFKASSMLELIDFSVRGFLRLMGGL